MASKNAQNVRAQNQGVQKRLPAQSQPVYEDEYEDEVLDEQADDGEPIYELIDFLEKFVKAVESRFSENRQAVEVLSNDIKRVESQSANTSKAVNELRVKLEQTDKTPLGVFVGMSDLKHKATVLNEMVGLYENILALFVQHAGSVPREILSNPEWIALQRCKDKLVRGAE